MHAADGYLGEETLDFTVQTLTENLTSLHFCFCGRDEKFGKKSEQRCKTGQKD